jgi:Concanavalin A-like lectin/glucanases superfamily
MLIDPYAFGSPSDPYFADVGLLLHMNDATSSTTLVDSSSNNLTTSVSGTVRTNTSLQQVGTSCLDFASAAGGSSAGAYTQTTVGAAGPIDLHAGDWTIEIWQYQRTSGAMIVWSTVYENHNTLIASGGNCTVYVEGTSLGTIPVPNNQWNHIAVCMISNVVTAYVNGVLKLTSSAITRLSWTGESWYVGGTQFGAALEGMAQEFRITKGVGRYTSGFSVPTLPFPNH